MAGKIVLVDTSILIDYFRKSDKTNSVWFKLAEEGYTCCISTITEFEILTGASESQTLFWENLLGVIRIIPFDHRVVNAAVSINKKLKTLNKKIEIADLFIGATAMAYNLPFSTLNLKHFNRIEDLQLI